jgi:hypothetical protein
MTETTVILAIGPAAAEGIGLLIVVVLGIATWLLLRSMNSQLRKVPKSFDPPANTTGPAKRDDSRH